MADLPSSNSIDPWMRGDIGKVLCPQWMALREWTRVLEQAIHPEILEQGDELRRMEGIPCHPVEMTPAMAVRGAKSGDLPLADFFQGATDLTFDIVSGPDGYGELEFRPRPQMVDMPKLTLSQPLMPLHPLRKAPSS